MNRYSIFGAAALIVACLPERGDAGQFNTSVGALRVEIVSSAGELPFGTYSLPDPDGFQMEALVGGKLRLVEKCLYVSSHIAVLPSEHTTWDPVANEITILGKRLQIGESIETNGGYIKRYSETESMLVDPIPVSCVGDSFVVVGTQAWVQ